MDSRWPFVASRPNDLDQAARAPAPWHGVVSNTDLRVYETAGFGKTVGLGRRPALLVIDVQYRTVGSAPRPILEAIEEYPTSCGDIGWRAVPHVATLIAIFRGASAPVLFPCVAPKTAHDAGGFAAKAPGVMSVDARGYEFVAGVAPQAGEIILPKAHASAFFGTALASYLVHFGVDSLVVAGCTTSGCIRATVVDACSLNYRVQVPAEAVYDRGTTSHAVSLFDMAQKYADVVTMPEAIRTIGESLRHG